MSLKEAVFTHLGERKPVYHYNETISRETFEKILQEQELLGDYKIDTVGNHEISNFVTYCLETNEERIYIDVEKDKKEILKHKERELKQLKEELENGETV